MRIRSSGAQSLPIAWESSRRIFSASSSMAIRHRWKTIWFRKLWVAAMI